MSAFTDLPLPPALLQALAARDYQQMTPIQAVALPPLLAGRDVLAQARTGSGKTAAFGLGLLTALRPEVAGVQALVLCPTRELADQVSNELRSLARFLPNIKVLSLCGGISIRPQLASLSHPPHIVVGTPGRIEDLLKRQALDFSPLRCLVLDEADRMLDMGFIDAVSRILERTPSRRQTGLFSATYPAEIQALSTRVQRDPVQLTVRDEDSDTSIEQRFFAVERNNKPAAIAQLLAAEQADACLIFANTKRDVSELAANLNASGTLTLALHGDLDQRQRDETLLQFANGSCRVLVATDVAARGLDIKALPLVIAYELPNDPQVHIHRIGRTGRAGASGRALALVSGRESSRLVALSNAATRLSELPSGNAARRLAPPAMGTLVIDAGRKDKLRPGDILGALTGVGELRAQDVGKIDVFATRAYVAIRRELLSAVLKRLRDQQIKGRHFRLRTL